MRHFLLAGLIFFAWVKPLQGKDQKKLEIAFVYKLLAFMNWDFKSPSKIDICVYASESQAQSFSLTLGGKTLHDRQLKVWIDEPYPKRCGVLVLMTQDRRVLDLVNFKGIIFTNYRDRSGLYTVQLILQSEYLRYRINLGQAKKTGVTIDPKILKHAIEIVE